ncbi:hypothetical protein LEP1GSC034_3540 [Leptospira interrogans str. 2003000735]|nr:hypothetical protein LEP1GSC027_2994 [Leptospira interrogans str. 2002000624]EKQ47640.1 hypothetical protein LEP1GSC026_4385 [Leptospira interrogans str. 2002000623]EMJ73960.1 hypothetical protein LEP1GSC033_2212 [Leptospira interrogans str. 2002000632]EMJ74739.1 hypothetical protein LEP1GSC034_3540 [Leptospira interrogans str. 2003000735]EMJ81318.1 hypothetical protein LEP1GSC032_1253 [Leptospira interrogans str. 2002000631]
MFHDSIKIFDYFFFQGNPSVKKLQIIRSMNPKFLLNGFV